MSSINLNYLTLITAIVNLVFGLLVLKSNSKNKLNQYFFIFTLALVAWAFTNFYVLQYSPTALWFRLTYSTGGLSLIAALPWVNVLTNKKFSTFLTVAYSSLALILFFLPLTTAQIIQGVSSNNGKVDFTSGPLFNLYGALLLVLLFYLLYRLFTGFKQANREVKSQIGLTLVGISIFGAVSITFGVILPIFNIRPVVPFDVQSSLIWVGLTAYAITKHGLFNIKVIATQGFIVILLLLILFRVIGAKTTADIIFESIVLVFSTIIGYFLSGSVRNEVFRREEIEKLDKEKPEANDELAQRNKNLRALQKIADIVLNENEMKPMTQKILDELPSQLDHCVGGFLSVVRKGELTAFALTSNQFNAKIFSIVGENLEKYSYPIKKEFNRLHEVIVSKQILDSDTLSDFISPPIPKTAALLLQKIVGARHIEAFPLYAGGVPFGVLMYVFSAPKDEIHGKNFEIAKSIAGEMSLAIQRAEAFQQLKDANEYLAQLDKMKDEFISMASHELNTPLAAIEGYLSMILDEHMGKVDAKSREYLSRAYDSSKRLAELILDLLNVSRIEQGRLKMKFAQTNLADLAESVIHELQIKADTKKIYLKLDSNKKDVPLTWCDPDRIREVFVNLAGNALKFTDKGGVTIKVTKGDGDTIVGSVTDTGRGIAKDDQKKLFQKFSQIHREVDEHQGTGLGLYISKNFVELHKGTLSVESDAGKGATFSFTLPIVKTAPKKLEGAILDQTAFSAPQISAETSPSVPAIVTASSKQTR